MPDAARSAPALVTGPARCLQSFGRADAGRDLHGELACRLLNGGQSPTIGPMWIVECIGCGAELQRRRRPSGPTWCSDRCRKRLTRPDPMLPNGDCPVCGTRFGASWTRATAGLLLRTLPPCWPAAVAAGPTQDTPIRTYIARGA